MFQLGNKIHITVKTSGEKEKRKTKKSIMLSTEFIHHHRFARKMYALFTSGRSFFPGTTTRKNPSFVFSASLLLRVVYCTAVRVDSFPRRAQSNMMTLNLSVKALNIIKNVRVDLISLEIFYSISQKL